MIRNSPRVGRLLGSRAGRAVDELDAGQTRLELRGQLRMVRQQLVTVGSLAGLEIGHVAVQDADDRRGRVGGSHRFRRVPLLGSGWSIVPSSGWVIFGDPRRFRDPVRENPDGPSHHHRADRHADVTRHVSNDHGGTNALAPQSVGTHFRDTRRIRWAWCRLMHWDQSTGFDVTFVVAWNSGGKPVSRIGNKVTTFRRVLPCRRSVLDVRRSGSARELGFVKMGGRPG